jgi:hypothetical protein
MIAPLEIFTGVRGRGIPRSPFAGSWIRPRNTPPRCAKPSPNRSACAVSVSAYTNNLRAPLLLRGVITPSPARPDLSERGYAELRHNGVLRS